MRFSERHGFAPVRPGFQVSSIDDPLRNSLWNAVDTHVIQYIGLAGDYGEDFLIPLWTDHYKLTLDKRPDTILACCDYIRFRFFLENPWYEPYEFIQFALDNFRFPDWGETNRKVFVSLCNRYLEREVSAYRILGRQIARLTSDQEIKAVEQAQAMKGKYASAAIHIKTALTHLSDRKAPDYRNSIKEAISAVESICATITGDPKATLGDALKKLERSKVRLHPALKIAFDKLYGYTSDAHGIRHALINDHVPDFEDAKFMLVSCSAFVSLLKARSS